MNPHRSSAPALAALRVVAFFLVSLVRPQPAPAAEPPVLRLAVGPFFAPVGSERLQQAGKLLPELLMVELSHQSRFQLVERGKVQAVWNELNLTASGLAARDNVARLGSVLACDWLVSGSLVQNDGRTVVWTKVVDIRNGVVLDLNASSYDVADLDRTVAAIGTFLSQAGTQSKARQFIAMGPFLDMNPRLSVAREDWAKRLPAAIEKHFHEAGYGIVEMGAVTPIFEERRLEAAGLTGHPEQRVKLQAAFWLVDGGCEWATNDAGQLSVGLRVQRVGGPEQMFRFTASAGEAAEKAVVETLAKALTDTRQATPELAAKAEADLLAARGMELATRNSPFRPSQSVPHKLTGTDQIQQQEEQKKRLAENRAATLAAYERTVLLDPKNFNAKIMLGYGLLFDADDGRREHGKELLREVVAANDPKYSARAHMHLTNANWYAREAARSAIPPVPSTDRVGLEKAVATNPSDWKAKYELGALLLYSFDGIERGKGADLLGEVMDKGPSELAEEARKRMPDWAMAKRARMAAAATAPAPTARDKGTNMLFFKFPDPEKLGATPTMTAAGVLPPRGFLVASGTALHHYDMEDGKLQRMELPPGFSHPITSIMADKQTIWLGTDGGGVLQLSASGVPQRQFGTNDGLLSLHVKALSLFDGRLWVGFGSGDTGGIGYIEASTGKFVALTSLTDKNARKYNPEGPPVSPVHAIKTADMKTVWVATRTSLKRYDIESAKWSTPLPFGPRYVSVAKTFVTASSPTGGVLVCEFSGNTWTHIPLSLDAKENAVHDLRAEGRRIWVGTVGAVRWIDVSDGEVIGGCSFPGGAARWVYPNPDYIWFVADSLDGGGSEFQRFWRRPAHVMQARSP